MYARSMDSEGSLMRAMCLIGQQCLLGENLETHFCVLSSAILGLKGDIYLWIGSGYLRRSHFSC